MGTAEYIVGCGGHYVFTVEQPALSESLHASVALERYSRLVVDHRAGSRRQSPDP